MARALRIQYDGAVFHVTSRGNERKPVFRDDLDRETFLEVLRTTNERHNWLCHAYCLMTNHYHLVIETVDGELSAGMRQLNGVYTQRFNRRRGRAGHLFQGRFKAIVIEKERHLLEVCRYVVLNPVRARLVKHPGEWTWSSYNGTSGTSAPHLVLTTDWILGQFGETRRRAQLAYREFVGEDIGGRSVWREMKTPGILGSSEFAARMLDYVKGHATLQEIPRRERLINRPGLAAIFTETTMNSKADRNRAMRVAVEEFGYRQKEIADHLELHYSTVSRLLNEEKSK